MDLGILLALVTVVAPDGSYVGTVNGAQAAVLARDDARYRAVQGAGLSAGDVVTTTDAGQATLYLHDGHVIYLGPATAVRLEGQPGEWRVHLERGEVRVTSNGRGRFEVATSSGNIAPGRGSVRARTDRYGADFSVERGRAGLTDVRGQRQTVESGQSIHVSGSKTATRHAAQRADAPWNIRVADYQLAAVQEHGLHALGLTDDPAPQHPKAQPHKKHGQKDDARVREEDEDDEQDLYEDLLRSDDAVADSAADEQVEDEQLRSGPSATLNSFGPGSAGALSLGGLSGSSFSLASASGFTDAAQDTSQGMLTRPYNGLAVGDPFPGNIHLVTGQSRYEFDDVNLTAAERSALFPTNSPIYWSIGLGAPPTSQVFTDFFTATDPTPTTIPIPGFDAYLLRLDQFGIPDPTLDEPAAQSSNIGLSGLLGDMPAGPTVVGATPLEDHRANADGTEMFNHQTTFTLGEFRVDPVAINGNDSLALNVRRTDQDRLIVKDPGNNDALDEVTPNTDVGSFDDVVDPRFLPQAPTVKVPTTGTYASDPIQAPTRYGNLDPTRRAAATTLLADQLFEYAQRTGQTRFVVDGRIVDISGYKK